MAVWGLFILAAGGFVAGAILDSPPLATPLDITWAASFFAFPSVGLVLALKIPRNPVGWLFTLGPGLVLWGVALDEAGVMEAGSAVFGMGLVAIFAALILFPDGRYPHRWVAVAHVTILLGLLIEPRISPESDGGVSLGANMLLVVITFAYRMITGSAVLRRQIMLPVLVALTGVTGLLLQGLAPFDHEWLGNLLIIWLLLGIPSAIAVSVLRYRLYDIDRLVSKTVSYVVVVAALGAAYAALVVGLRMLLPVHGDLPVAVSTLAVASVFVPLGRRVQRVVDRRFFRSRYNAGVVVARVAEDLRGSLDLAEVTTNVARVIGDVFAPRSVGVWVAPEP